MNEPKPTQAAVVGKAMGIAGEYFAVSQGRWFVYMPGRNHVLRSRVVMETHLGWPLDEMQVHHINGDKTDDRLENLQITDAKAHAELHRRQQRAAWPHSWSAQYACCIRCGTCEHPHVGHGFCARCYGQCKKQDSEREYLWGDEALQFARDALRQEPPDIT